MTVLPVCDSGRCSGQGVPELQVTVETMTKALCRDCARGWVDFALAHGCYYIVVTEANKHA